ncbi:MAG: secretin N-terminal domain-containing protein [Planctomycetaceae bacterium]
MRQPFQSVVTLLIACFVAILCADVTQAQPGRGGRGGGRGGDRGLLGTLRSDDVRSELNLTEEQIQQIEELGEQARNFGDNGDLFQRMRDATTDEEREALREEMRSAFEQRRRESDEQLKSILNEQQTTRLQQVSLQQQGLRALGQDEVAESLGLTDDQKSQIKTLVEERDYARRELGFRASEEDRAKFDEEWNTKFAAVLTPEQQQSWQQRLGPPLGSQDGAATTNTAPPQAPAKRAAFEMDVPEGAEAVASFAAVDGQQSTARDQTPRGDNGPTLSFNFRYAPWSIVLQRFADVAGLTLDLNDVPPGTFNHYDDKQYTVTEALDVLNGYLLARGYVLVRRDNFLVSLNIDQGIPPNLVPTIDASELLNRGRNELLTVVFPLAGADVNLVAGEVEKLKGPQGTVVGMTATNSLIVTDIGSNLRRIQSMLQNVAPGSEDMIFRPYTLTNISAEEAELLIKHMLGVATGVTNVSSTSDRGRFDFRSRDRESSRDAIGSANMSNARIIADPRTNRLLATASPSEHQIIEEAVKTIDVEASGSFMSKKPYLFTYAVSNSDAREVTKSIDALMPGIVVNEDGRNGLINIMATPVQHEEVRELIRKLDGAGGGTQVSVIPLSNMDPSLAVLTLQGLFIRDGDNAPTIQADMIGRQVMIRGTESQILQVRQVLTDLGEDGTGSARSNRGPIRTFNLSSRDPAEVLPILEQLWKTRKGSSIRVVNPPGTFQGGPRVLEDEPRHTPEPPPAASNAPAEEDQQTSRDVRTADPFMVSVDDAEDTSSVDTLEPAGASPVTIRVTGSDLVLISQDQEALDEMEQMLEDVLQAIPPRTTWTVIPLQSADATEASAMLEQLFPDSSVSQTSSSSSGVLGMLTSGVSSFGSSVGQMTGLNSLGTGPQTLRIIPDVRLNALFVSGPTYRVDEVRDMLEVLDASGLTESLRDRVPRMIPVKYAEINEVYEIVKSVYEPELQAPRGAGVPGGAFAALLGGGRGDRGSRGGDESAPLSELQGHDRNRPSNKQPDRVIS